MNKKWTNLRSPSMKSANKLKILKRLQIIHVLLSRSSLISELVQKSNKSASGASAQAWKKLHESSRRCAVGNRSKLEHAFRFTEKRMKFLKSEVVYRSPKLKVTRSSSNSRYFKLLHFEKNWRRRNWNRAISTFQTLILWCLATSLVSKRDWQLLVERGEVGCTCAQMRRIIFRQVYTVLL